MADLSFQLIPRLIDGATVLRYRCDVWPGVRGPYTLDGQTFPSTLCVELGLLPDHVELLLQHHLTGAGAPRTPSGRSVTPEEVILRQPHDDFLADRSAIAAAGARWFPAEAWPGVLDEAAYILTKARAEGRWRRHLEVRNTAAQIDAALDQLRRGARLDNNSPYTSHRYRWDPEAQTFEEHQHTENPYSGEVREDRFPITEARMREVLESIAHVHLGRRLR